MFATWRSGDWRHSSSTPSPRDGVAEPGGAAVDGAAIAVRPGGDLVGHAVLGHRGGEAIAGGDQPVDHEARVGQAADAEPRRVGEAGGDQVVEDCVAVGRVDVAQAPDSGATQARPRS
jgi:hypothetical protein